MPAAPVRWTCTPLPESEPSLPFSESAAATIRLLSRAAPAWTIAVCPSREIEIPGWGGTTVLIAPSARSVRSTRVIAERKAGSVAVLVGE